MVTPRTEIVVSIHGVEVLRLTVEPGEYVIGRDPECHVYVRETDLSRKHAKLIVNFDHSLIEDLGSSNGTFVNESPVTGPTRLWPNQRIRLGASTVLSVRRLRTGAEDGNSLAPTQAVIKRILPDEFLRERKYDIGGIVAQGGMGAILSAREATTGRNVAMKVMLDSLSQDGLLRFIGEAKVSAQLEHPNIVPVYEIGVDENEQVFYTMKYVKGITLKGVIEKLVEGDPETVKKYPLPVLLTVFQKVCDAIAFAHNKGVIHRDLKPENIMLGDFGEVLVMDWGLAKILAERTASKPHHHSAIHTIHGHGNASSTLAGSILGTPQYMSPEQAEGNIESLDPRSDIYSLGAILYWILTRRPPISGEDADVTVARVTLGKIDPITSPNKKSKIPESLTAVVKKAMALHQVSRYRTVAALQADITAFQNGFATGAERANFFKQLLLFVRRNKTGSIGVAAVLFVAATLGARAVFEGAVAQQQADRAKATLDELRGTAPTFYEQAQFVLDEGRADEAMEKVGFAIRLDDTNPDYRLFRANLYESSQHLPEAVKEYGRVLDLRPGDTVAKTNLALCQKLLDQTHGAAPGRTQLGELLLALRQQKRLVESAPLAAILDPDIASAKAAILARLIEIRKQPGWTDSHVMPFGGGLFKVNLNGFAPGDLSVLKGQPIAVLDLSNTGIQDLSVLAGMPLRELALNGDNVANLAPLHGMTLQKLDIRNNPVTDLSPLTGMTLTWLDCSDDHTLTDLSPLQEMPLTYLNIARTHVSNLAPIATPQLIHLDISHSAVSDLAPLAQCTMLRELIIHGPLVTDLTPISKLGLNLLVLRDSSSATSLVPLRGMPLRYLSLMDSRITDLSPLADIPTLEDLILPANATDLSMLRKLPRLRMISTRTAGMEWGSSPNQTAEEFWKDYDGKRPGAKHGGKGQHHPTPPAPPPPTPEAQAKRS